ncbi:AAA family ATPase [Rhizobium ruizarguesonis]|uniref:ATP-binding protein n=1 Tax=Rhizobium ruizarguesonis TaxID=2081791 RepID=UPI003720BD59
MVNIHITGALGSGTSTLGRALAAKIDALHLDSDDFYWLPTNPPFQRPRPVDDRVALFLQKASPARSWVLSGSALKWGRPFETHYHLVVFLQVDAGIRMERLRRRETARYGKRVQPFGDMALQSAEFLSWAESYDTAGPERRSLAAHEQWLAGRICPVLRLDSAQPIEALIDDILQHPVFER